MNQVPTQKLGPILESAVLKAPALNLKAGNKMAAINRFRSILQAEETESTKEIRRNVCCKLAEVLLYGVSDTQYVKPEADSPKRPLAAGGHFGHHRSTPNAISDSPWKPRRHTANNLFIPKTRHEEILLVLMLSEKLARKNTVLSQNPEFFGVRATKFRDAIIAYDLSAIALSRVRHQKLLCDMLEKSMKFSFNEPHTWRQFGLSLSADNKHCRSLHVFRELADRNQADAGSCLCMAKLCYEKLNLYEEGLEWSKRALKKDDADVNHALKARCNIYLGIGYSLRHKGVENNNERIDILDKALKHFTMANHSDSNDHLTEYYLAYHHAQARNIDVATERARSALKLHPDHLASLHMLILLLSSKKDYSEALEVCDQTLEEFPGYLPLMSLKVRLEELVNGGESAVLTAKG